MKIAILRLLSGIALVVVLYACHKSPLSTGGGGQVTYGDSVFYLKSSNYTINPVNTRAGTYT